MATTEMISPGPWTWECDTFGEGSLSDANGETTFRPNMVGGCESDPWGFPYDNAKIDGKFIVSAVNAMFHAAHRLGLDPAVLAERLKDGGIAELVDAAEGLSAVARMVAVEFDTLCFSDSLDVTDAALKLFAENRPCPRRRPPTDWPPEQSLAATRSAS